jgi:Ca2+-binding RTX toxin-like protein
LVVITRGTYRMVALVAILAAVAAGSAQAAPPAHDNFSAAAPLTGSKDTFKDTNREATKEPGEPNHAGGAGGASVWHRWVAPRNGRLFVTTRGSGVDTLLAVYTGTSVDALTEVASNDDAPNTTRKTSDLDFVAVKDTVYYIAVDGFTGRGGTIVLSWVQGPENDDFANAQVIEGAAGRVEGEIEAGTREAGEPGGPSQTIWYRWTAPRSMPVRFDTRGSRSEGGSFYATLSAYRGTEYGALKRLDSSSGFYNGFAYLDDAFIAFRATAGTTYHIAVGGGGQARVLLNWGLGAIIWGTRKADRLVGTAGADIIVSGGGDDVIRSLAGDDEIVVDGGDDRVSAGGGNDWVVGGAGDDELRGEGGNDRLLGRDAKRGNDLLVGGAGRDTCTADREDRKQSCP